MVPRLRQMPINILSCGKKPLQKSIETLEEALSKLKEYTQKIHICGERNSYSKTDSDATFMRMKDDAMGNGELKRIFKGNGGLKSATTIVFI